MPRRRKPGSACATTKWSLLAPANPMDRLDRDRTPTNGEVDNHGRTGEECRGSEAEFIAMHIVHVHVHVKPECVADFITATLANARASGLEPGIARFDVVQQTEHPTRFILVEAYRNPAAQAAHRETAHYLTWRDTVAPMMAEPRTAVKLVNLHPDDAGW